MEKKEYRKPRIETEKLEEANAQGQGSGGGGGGKTCNGTPSGGRKDTAGAGCVTLLT